MRSLSMMESPVPGRKKGYRQVQVEPSVRADIVHPNVGIYMSINDHFEASEGEAAADSASCIEWLGSTFDESISFSKSIVDHIQTYARSI